MKFGGSGKRRREDAELWRRIGRTADQPQRGRLWVLAVANRNAISREIGMKFGGSGARFLQRFLRTEHSKGGKHNEEDSLRGGNHRISTASARC